MPLSQAQTPPAVSPGPAFGEQQQYQVFLNVYDVVNTGNENINNIVVRINNIGRDLGLGGVFHGAIQIDSFEWSFGYCERGTGVYCVHAKTNPMYQYRETVALGTTGKTKQEIKVILQHMKAEWQGPTYELLSRNCCHFCEAFARQLHVKPVPAWVNRFATGADATVTFTNEAMTMARNVSRSITTSATQFSDWVKDSFSRFMTPSSSEHHTTDHAGSHGAHAQHRHHHARGDLPHHLQGAGQQHMASSAPSKRSHQGHLLYEGDTEAAARAQSHTQSGHVGHPYDPTHAHARAHLSHTPGHERHAGGHEKGSHEGGVHTHRSRLQLLLGRKSHGHHEEKQGDKGKKGDKGRANSLPRATVSLSNMPTVGAPDEGVVRAGHGASSSQAIPMSRMGGGASGDGAPSFSRAAIDGPISRSVAEEPTFARADASSPFARSALVGPQQLRHVGSGQRSHFFRQPCTDLASPADGSTPVHSPFGESDEEDEAGADASSPLPNMARAAYVPDEWRAWGVHGSTAANSNGAAFMSATAPFGHGMLASHGSLGGNSGGYNADAPLSAGFGSYTSGFPELTTGRDTDTESLVGGSPPRGSSPPGSTFMPGGTLGKPRVSALTQQLDLLGPEVHSPTHNGVHSPRRGSSAHSAAGAGVQSPPRALGATAGQQPQTRVAQEHASLLD